MGRPTLKDPSDPGWPDHGERTEFEDVARRWAWVYVDRHRERTYRRQSGQPPESPRLDAAVERFMAHREHHVALNTQQADRTALGHLMDYVGTSTRLDAIETDDLQEWVDARLAEGYKPSTVERYRLAWSAFFEWAGRVNPASDVRTPDPGKRDVRPFWDDEIERIRKAASSISEQHRRYVELGLATGGRYSELLALRYEDIDREKRVVRFTRQAVNEGTKRTKVLKGKRSRSAYVLPDWWPWHPEDARGRIVRGRRLLVPVLEAAGIDEPEVLNHAMRHAYSRRCLEAGVPMHVLGQWLGHASVTTTEQLYNWLTGGKAAEFGIRAFEGGA